MNHCGQKGAIMADEADLVRKALKGDRKAFEMIVHRYEQPIINYLGRVLGDRELSLDFAQDVFLKAYASLKSYKPSYKFSTWLFKIASNHVIDHWRKKNLVPFSLDRSSREDDEALLPQAIDPGHSVARNYELAELKARIEQALLSIPAGLRELFVLRHVNELSYEEIAAVKNLPVGTVKNRVFQAKELIRKKVEADS